MADVSEHLPAKNNPFSLRKNTKLISEQNIPDSTLPKITVEKSMKNYLVMSTLGHLDSMDLEIVYWISNLQYAKSTFLYDLIIGGFIEIPVGKSISRDNLNTRLMRLYKVKLIDFYKLCSVDEKGIITNKSNHRILMVTAYGRTQLRTIGRKSNYEFFMTLDNIEKILNKLSVNQWFTKYITLFKNTFYYLDTIVTAKIAETNDFLHAHFHFDLEGGRIPEVIEEFLEAETTGNQEKEPEEVNKQSVDEDERILKELEYEERQMMLLMEE